MKILDFSQDSYKKSSFVIPHWYGRFGNNIIQVANGLVLSEVFGGSFHNFLFHSQIHTFETRTSCNHRVVEKFFSNDSGKHLIENMELSHESRKVWAEKFSLYVRHVLDSRLKFSIEGPVIPEETLVVHLRGEDVFLSNQANYTQCPLSHILTVARQYDKVIVVYQDKMNPIVSTLENLPNFEMQSLSIEEDFSTLYRASHLLIGGCSSFSEIAAIGSNHKRLVYTSSANRFNNMIRMNCDTVHLTLSKSYCGGKLKWNRDSEQMMKYSVTEEDYKKVKKQNEPRFEEEA